MADKKGASGEKVLYCSFCGKSQHEVKKLIAGPSVFICDECIELCNDIIRDEFRPMGPAARRQVGPAGPSEIKASLDQYVIGQDVAKRTLSVAVYNHYKRLKHMRVPRKDEVELTKSNILLIGPTGSGKTLLAQTLAKLLNVPFVIADATTLTEAGYVGEDVENIIQKLLQNCNYDVERRSAASSTSTRSTRSAARPTTPQHHARRVGRGRAAGAAEAGRRHDGQRAAAGRAQAPEPGLPADRHDQHPVHLRRRLRRPGKGHPEPHREVGHRFRRHRAQQDREAVSDLFREVEPEDLIKFGLIPELVGRLPVVATLGELTEEAMVQILTEPKNALVKQYQKLFAMDGVELEIRPSALSPSRARRWRARPARADCARSWSLR
jgi:ATP-dependent Clp protease ATP-binding subunit ClpX